MKLRHLQLAVFALVGVLVACDRHHEPPKPPPVPTPDPPAPSAAPSCTLAPIPLRHPQPKRVVAIGDIHGDIAGARSALRAAGVIDDKDAWIGKDTVVVQTGDLLDRGDDEQDILDLMFELETDARAAGGEVILLLGNHELMNAAGDFRYVTTRGMDDFPGGRVQSLGPGGVYAKKLAAHDVVMIVGDTVYSHAGVIGDWAAHVDEVNQTSRCWLDGQAGGAADAPLAMQSEESPVWTRAFGIDPVDCTAVTDALTKLGAKRMVVAHTVQKAGITSACGGAVWRIDVGLAKLYDGPIEVLELVDGAEPKVLKGAR